MNGEERQESGMDRVYDALDGVHRRYEAVEERVNAYTPYVVRTLEVVLAIALIVGLTRWFYMFYVA